MPALREPVFLALLAVAQSASWDTPARTWVSTSRRVKLFNEVMPSQQPALFQAEHDENIAQVSNMPYKQVWNATWIIYQCTGNDPMAEPTIENNLILDALFAAMVPKIQAGVSFDPKRNTLGGLVHHCYIDGDIFKDPGDIDKQGMLVVPIKILVP